MAKKFDNAGSVKSFAEVAQKADEKASVVVLVNVSSENLIDNPKNGEDVEFTADLEQSMRQMGFTDPLEVTDYGMEDGKYMILSGHRRRVAGVRIGITVFPCVVRHFDSAEAVQNYTLLSNTQRDSAKDPFLFAKRYRLHEQYLKDGNFSGNIRQEVARRLGLSVQQADRYNTMNKVIMDVWDMVRAEEVSMSAVVPLASRPELIQREILVIMREAQKAGNELTRDIVKRIVDGHKDGKRTWAEVADLPRDSGLPLNSFMNTEAGETSPESSENSGNRNDEVRREFDPIGAEADKDDAGKQAWEEAQQETQRQEQGDFGEGETGDNGLDDRKLTDEQRAQKRGKDIIKTLAKLENLFNEFYAIDGEDVEAFIQQTGAVVALLADEAYKLADRGGKDVLSSFRTDFRAAKQNLVRYCKGGSED